MLQKTNNFTLQLKTYNYGSSRIKRARLGITN